MVASIARALPSMLGGAIGCGLIGAWIWGLVRYLQAGDGGMFSAAFTFIPIGVLHGLGLY
jgi:hypothetical protein